LLQLNVDMAWIRGITNQRKTVVDIRNGQVRVLSPSGYQQFPIRYSDGVIAYDWPEIVPEYAKIQVMRTFKQLRNTSAAT